MIPRIPVGMIHGRRPAQRPMWKRPRVVVVAAVIVVAIIVYVLSPAGKNASHRGNPGGPKDAFIGQVAAYEPVTPDAPPTTPARRPLERRRHISRSRAGRTPTPTPPPMPAGSPPPLPPSIRAMMEPGGQQAPPPHPKMLVYALPPLEKPAPVAEPEETRIGFKPATLPGAKAASPAIDKIAALLLPGLLPLVLDTAVQSDLQGPPGSPAGPGLLDRGRNGIGS